jgi:hypothetical protein
MWQWNGSNPVHSLPAGELAQKRIVTYASTGVMMVSRQSPIA